MATVADPAIAELEAKLKSTLLALSHIISFHNSLNQLQATNYAPQAPKKLTRQLRTEAAGFDAVCDQLEHRVLKAMAILERDARKAAGEPVLVSDDNPALPSPQPDAQPPNSRAAPRDQPTDTSSSLDATAIPASTADLTSLFPYAPLDPTNATSQPLNLDGTIPASAGMDLDLSFLNTSAPLDSNGPAAGEVPLDLSFLSDTSLFPNGGDATTSADPPPTLFPTTTAPPQTSSAPGTAPTPTAPTPNPTNPADPAAPPSMPDLASLLAMANNFPTSAADGATGPATADGSGAGAIAPGFEGGMDLFGGMDLTGADGTGSLEFDMAGLDGLDFSNLGDLGDLGVGGDVGEIDFDALLKSMPSG